MSWVRCAFGNLNIVRPELETLSYFHWKPGSFNLRWNTGWRFWAFVLRRIFGNSWRCQIHPVTFYMTRKGRRNFKCNILTKHREFWKQMTFLISNLLQTGLHFLLDVLISWADRGSCAQDQVRKLKFLEPSREMPQMRVFEGEKNCSWPPLNKYAMNVWLSSLRIRAHLREGFK